MSVTMTHRPATPAIEVRVYDGARLLVRELCDSEDDTGAVVDRWSDVATLFVVADVPAARPTSAAAESEETIATALVPALGDD